MGLVLAAARKILAQELLWTGMEMHISLEPPLPMISLLSIRFSRL